MSRSTLICLLYLKLGTSETSDREMTVYNPHKGRLETVRLECTTENTTWFERNTKTGSITSITDYKGGILIRTMDYNYPVWVSEVTREDIGYSHKKAQTLLKRQVKGN